MVLTFQCFFLLTTFWNMELPLKDIHVMSGDEKTKMLSQFQNCFNMEQCKQYEVDEKFGIYGFMDTILRALSISKD